MVRVMLTSTYSRWMIVLVLILVSATAQMVSADSIADHVVISEVMIDGVGGKEFVELYNPTNSEVSLKDWEWCYYSSSANWSSPTNHKTFPSDAFIASHCFYLIVTQSGDDVGIIEDWNLGYANHHLSNDKGSVAIFPDATYSESNRVDAVAWGSVGYVKESTEASVTSSGESLQRKVNDTINKNAIYGPAWDSDDNSADFFIQDSPNPTNSTTSSADPMPPVPELPTLTLFSVGLLIIAGCAYMGRRAE